MILTMENSQSTMQAVRQYVEAQRGLKAFSIRTLLHLGSRAAVDQCLSRLRKAGIIVRLSRGIYSASPAATPPSLLPADVIHEVITQSIDSRAVNDQDVLSALGSTQAEEAGRLIYWTKARSRRLEIGHHQVELRRLAPRKLALAGSPAGSVLVALWHLGKQELCQGRLEAALATLEPSDIKRLIKCRELPGWMSDAIWFSRYRHFASGPECTGEL